MESIGHPPSHLRMCGVVTHIQFKNMESGIHPPSHLEMWRWSDPSTLRIWNQGHLRILYIVHSYNQERLQWIRGEIMCKTPLFSCPELLWRPRLCRNGIFGPSMCFVESRHVCLAESGHVFFEESRRVFFGRQFVLRRHDPERVTWTTFSIYNYFVSSIITTPD